jgi:hypothetical protein
LSRENLKIFLLYNFNWLNLVPFFEPTGPLIFSVSISADPSLLMSSTLNRYVYPVCRI